MQGMGKVTIKYSRTGRIKKMREAHAVILERLGLASRIEEPEAQGKPKPKPKPKKDQPPDEAAISPRTGKPNRQFKRRDLSAEE
jgi:hypothetical protein